MATGVDVVLRAGMPPNYDTNSASAESGLSCPEGDDFAQQQFKEEADINTIVRRFGLTGELPEHPSLPRSGDFTNVIDYASAMNAVRKADEGFMELPGELRARFNNDPQVLMTFIANPANIDEARKLGLFERLPEVTRDAAPPAPPAA